MNRIKIKNTTVNITVVMPEPSEIRDEIKKFDLSDKTPIDCMNYLRTIKERIKNGIL